MTPFDKKITRENAKDIINSLQMPIRDYTGVISLKKLQKWNSNL